MLHYVIKYMLLTSVYAAMYAASKYCKILVFLSALTKLESFNYLFLNITVFFYYFKFNAWDKTYLLTLSVRQSHNAFSEIAQIRTLKIFTAEHLHPSIVQ